MPPASTKFPFALCTRIDEMHCPSQPCCDAGILARACVAQMLHNRHNRRLRVGRVVAENWTAATRTTHTRPVSCWRHHRSAGDLMADLQVLRDLRTADKAWEARCYAGSNRASIHSRA